MTTERTMYAVFTEDELDQICETEAQAKKEQHDNCEAWRDGYAKGN